MFVSNTGSAETGCFSSAGKSVAAMGTDANAQRLRQHTSYRCRTGGW